MPPAPLKGQLPHFTSGTLGLCCVALAERIASVARCRLKDRFEWVASAVLLSAAWGVGMVVVWPDWCASAASVFCAGVSPEGGEAGPQLDMWCLPSD